MSTAYKILQVALIVGSVGVGMFMSIRAAHEDYTGNKLRGLVLAILSVSIPIATIAVLSIYR